MSQRPHTAAHLPAAEGHPHPAAPLHWWQTGPTRQRTHLDLLPAGLLPASQGKGKASAGPHLLGRPERNVAALPGLCSFCPLCGSALPLVRMFGPPILSSHPRPAAAKANSLPLRPASLRLLKQDLVAGEGDLAPSPPLLASCRPLFGQPRGAGWDVTASTVLASSARSPGVRPRASEGHWAHGSGHPRRRP